MKNKLQIYKTAFFLSFIFLIVFSCTTLQKASKKVCCESACTGCDKEYSSTYNWSKPEDCKNYSILRDGSKMPHVGGYNTIVAESLCYTKDQKFKECSKECKTMHDSRELKEGTSVSDCIKKTCH